MTEIVEPKCIAPDCHQPTVPDGALCPFHKEKLQRIEEELLADATRRIRAEMRQFERLIYVEPPLHSAEIAHRMALPLREVRKLLKKFRDDRA